MHNFDFEQEKYFASEEFLAKLKLWWNIADKYLTVLQSRVRNRFNYLLIRNQDIKPSVWSKSRTRFSLAVVDYGLIKANIYLIE
jgi:hypothetical protein